MSEPAAESDEVSSETTVGGDTSFEPAVDERDAPPESAVGDAEASSESSVVGDDAPSERPTYCNILTQLDAIDFMTPTAVVEAYVLNGQLIVALVEEGPDIADELFLVVDIAERVGDMDPATLEPTVELFPFDDPNDPLLGDLDPEVRGDAAELIAFQTALTAADTDGDTSDELDEMEQVVEGECASAGISVDDSEE